MSLTTRLTAFLLAALALVLAGFSVALVLLARSYLQRQADDRLEAGLSTLVAAIEFHDTTIEWEPNSRLVTLGQGLEAEQVRWLVRSDSGAVVARSENLAADNLLASLPLGETRGQRPAAATVRERPWRILQRRVTGRDRPGPSPEPPQRHDYRLLFLTAGLDMAPIETGLATLVRGSIGLSLGLWVLAALVARRLCRRALRPVTEMVAAARGMSADEQQQRLPVAATGDELQQLGEAFNGLLARLQEAFSRQRRFTGDASHQLRTPLAAILGQIEVSLRRERSADDYRRVLSLVHEQAAHLNQVVEMLLFLSRADAESELPDLEALDLASWIAAQLPRWAGSARAGDVSVITGHGPHLVRVHPPLLAQLLDNLVDNASKYSATGTPITIEVRRELDQIALAVADRGSGIDPADLPHIFEPFYRSPRARRAGTNGVGLGLSVAQRIAKALRGTLVARSEPGQGSRFELLLPLAGP